jgi:hypothetical protein
MQIYITKRISKIYYEFLKDLQESFTNEEETVAITCTINNIEKAQWSDIDIAQIEIPYSVRELSITSLGVAIKTLNDRHAEILDEKTRVDNLMYVRELILLRTALINV